LNGAAILALENQQLGAADERQVKKAKRPNK
jgi:hypothetical protein